MPLSAAERSNGEHILRVRSWASDPPNAVFAGLVFSDVEPEPSFCYYRARYYDPSTGRFLNEDPARNGPNFYDYVRNNPGSRMDPSGLWDTDTHSKLIWNALKPCGVDNNTIYQLQEASRIFDDETGLDPGQAFKHAMKAPGQGDEDAINARNQFVASQLRLASATFDDGEGWLWQDPFAQAIHTLMDMTSPLHMRNGRPITWPSGNAVKHGGILSKAESWETMMKTPGLMEYNLTLIRDAWQSMTGKKCGCQ